MLVFPFFHLLRTFLAGILGGKNVGTPVLNVGGYIGTSTRRELEYARRLGKRIEFLEDPGQLGLTG